MRSVKEQRTHGLFVNAGGSYEEHRDPCKLVKETVLPNSPGDWAFVAYGDNESHLLWAILHGTLIDAKRGDEDAKMFASELLSPSPSWGGAPLALATYLWERAT